MKLTISKENYCGTVVKIDKTTKLPNCDNVVGATFFGNQVIVPNTTPLGEVGVYFPAGSKLSNDFLSNNNLYRDQLLNKNQEKRGYFETNGRVKAVAFRKQESNGFYMPLDCLEYTCNIKELKVGDRFNEIDGVEIVTKYLPTKGKASNSASSLEQLGVVDGHFELHRDTKHFAQNLDAIKMDSEISVTLKMHGCLPAKQTITMADGLLKQIKDVKIGDLVLGYNHEQQIPETVKVLNTFINGHTTEWVQIKKKSTISNKGKKNKNLLLTKNHKIFVKNKGYIDYFEYSVGDVILSEREDYILDPIRKSILTGMLLGDAYLDIHATNWSVVYGHKADHECYIDYIASKLSNFCTQVKRYRVSGFGTKMIDGRTKHSNIINQTFGDWIINKKKHVPSNLTLDKYSLAFWYMDDGSLSHTDLQKDRASFAVCGFDDNDCENLKTALITFGFSNFTFFKSDNGKYNRLRLNASDADLLFKSIADLIPDCMQYKLPLEYRGRFINIDLPLCEKIFYIEESIISDVKIVNPYKIGGHTAKYDIETETHNFFAGDILVHNSSIAFGRVLAENKLTLGQKIYKFFGKKYPVNKYISLVASRNVIKDPNRKLDGYDLWVETAKPYLLWLDDGIVLYGEIVGFYPDGKAIQKGYDYGCRSGESKFLCYRCVRVFESGIKMELSFAEMRERLDGMGFDLQNPTIEFVPMRFEGKAMDLAKEFGCTPTTDAELQECIMTNLKREIEIVEPLCTNKVPREGYVVRVENLSSKPAYKLKSFLFLKYEDSQIDTGEVDVETAQSL